MQLGHADSSVGEPNGRITFELAPSTKAKLLAKPHDVPNAASHCNCLNIPDFSDNLKWMFHFYGIESVGSVSTTIIGGMIPSRLMIVAPTFRASYFSTANTDRHRTFLTGADVRSALQEGSRTLRLTRPFLIEPLLPAPSNESTRTRALRSL